MNTEITTKTTNFKPLNIDLDKLVTEARGLYGKKEAGLSKQISKGTSLTRADKDEDFVMWNHSDHWSKLCGIKGIPYGRIIQIAGKPDSGKSTHAMCFMVEAQKQGALVILWDAEGKFSARRYESKMGGDANSLVVIQTNNTIEGSKHIANVITAAKTQNPKIKVFIVWDSVGASLNSNDDDDETEDYSKQPGADAKQVTWAIKKINKIIFRCFDKESGDHSVACLIVNQVYANIGSVGFTEKGGQQLQYLSSIILQLSRKKDLNKVKKGVSVKYGIVTRAKVKKNHLFDGDECVAELDLEVSASGIRVYAPGKSTDDDSEIVEAEDNE